jgi:hypothetical protein
VIGGLQEIIRLTKELKDPLILRALCKIIVTMVPNPEDLLVRHVWNCFVGMYVRMFETVHLYYKINTTVVNRREFMPMIINILLRRIMRCLF